MGSQPEQVLREKQSLSQVEYCLHMIKTRLQQGFGSDLSLTDKLSHRIWIPIFFQTGSVSRTKAPFLFYLFYDYFAFFIYWVLSQDLMDFFLQTTIIAVSFILLCPGSELGIPDSVAETGSVALVSISPCQFELALIFRI